MIFSIHRWYLQYVVGHLAVLAASTKVDVAVPPDESTRKKTMTRSESAKDLLTQVIRDAGDSAVNILNRLDAYRIHSHSAAGCVTAPWASSFFLFLFLTLHASVTVDANEIIRSVDELESEGEWASFFYVQICPYYDGSAAAVAAAGMEASDGCSNTRHDSTRILDPPGQFPFVENSSLEKHRQMDSLLEAATSSDKDSPEGSPGRENSASLKPVDGSACGCNRSDAADSSR